MSVRRSLAWSVSAQIICTAIAFAGSVVIARLLTPTEVGIYAVSFATWGLLGIIGTVGISAYLVREPTLSPKKIATAFTVNAGFCVLVALAVYLASFPAATFLSEPGVGIVLRTLALRPIFSIFELLPQALLQRSMEFKRIAIVSTVSTILGTAVLMLLAYLGFSYMSLAYSALVSGAASVALYCAAGRQHVSLRLSIADWRPLAAFTARMLTISGTAMLVHRVSEVIMGRLLGLASLGLYTRATQISDLLFFNVYGAATRVAFVKLSQDYRSGRDIASPYLTAMQMITAILWPLYFGLAILSRPVISTLFGEAWLSAAAPLALLMVGQFVATWFGMNWELFVLKNETARQTKLELGRAVVSLGFFSVGCLFSIVAAAGGRVADALFGFFLYRSHIRRLAGFESNELYKIFRGSLFLAAVATAPSFVLMASYSWSPNVPNLAIIFATCLGIGLWMGTIALTRHPLLDEFKRILQMLRVAQRDNP